MTRFNLKACIAFLACITLFAIIVVMIGFRGKPGNAEQRKGNHQQTKSSVQRLLLPVVVDGDWGYIDKNGKVQVALRFDKAEPFSEGLAAVCIGGEWGFIDSEGRVAIPFEFDYTRSFSEGKAAVRKGSKWSYVNKKGKVLFEVPYHKAFDFSDDLALVANTTVSGGGTFDTYISRTDAFGYINTQGKLSIDLVFSDALPFKDGLAAIRRKGESTISYIDKDGNNPFVGEFNGARSFSDGYASVESEGKHGYIRKSGEYLIQPKFQDGEDFSEALAPVKFEDKWGFITPEGTFVITPRFDSAGYFREGRAAVKLGDYFGYIDTSGQIVIKPQFETAWTFKSGFAKVQYQDRICYIDKEGNMIWDSRSYKKPPVKPKEISPERIKKDLDGKSVVFTKPYFLFNVGDSMGLGIDGIRNLKVRSINISGNVLNVSVSFEFTALKLGGKQQWLKAHAKGKYEKSEVSITFIEFSMIQTVAE